MNNSRRKNINKLAGRIATFKTLAENLLETQILIDGERASIIGWLENFSTDIEDIQSEEQEYIDNLPENLQQSEQASTAEVAVSNMDDAKGSIDEVKDKFDNLWDELDAASSSLESAAE